MIEICTRSILVTLIIIHNIIVQQRNHMMMDIYRTFNYISQK